MTVSWESPADPVTGYVIYYQTKGEPVISDMVSGGETETHSLDGLQRGITYYISILALSQHLPSPLVGNFTFVGESFPSPSSHHVLLSLDPLLVVETSPESLTTSPNTQFSLNCTARAMVDGETVPVEMKWECGSANELMINTTEDQERGTVIILTSSEDGTVNSIIYRCTATLPDGTSAFRDITIFVDIPIPVITTTIISAPTFTAITGKKISSRGEPQLKTICDIITSIADHIISTGDVSKFTGLTTTLLSEITLSHCHHITVTITFTVTEAMATCTVTEMTGTNFYCK